ncbi:cytochrome c3 family protein [Paraferrimonas haliotis]|uniref:Cytochrome c n=1 Tax=Paraferrimonas haliotis TaxID=2013866 RepID=A0AA37TNG6_9GAMM|nr:cytochrome c3 family protein [Paraferrimonas haliotis]GLS82883.1 cytochrome c [Paraferrimonas haliotis]
MFTRKLLILACMLSVFGVANGALAAKMPLKSYHQEMFTDHNGNVDCAACHGVDKPKSPPATEDCLQCHDLKDVVAATEPPAKTSEFEPNPHNSPHYAQDLDCSYCHAEHRKPKVYCNNCHEFKYPNMPRK